MIEIELEFSFIGLTSRQGSNSCHHQIFMLGQFIILSQISPMERFRWRFWDVPFPLQFDQKFEISSCRYWHFPGHCAWTFLCLQFFLGDPVPSLRWISKWYSYVNLWNLSVNFSYFSEVFSLRFTYDFRIASSQNHDHYQQVTRKSLSCLMSVCSNNVTNKGRLYINNREEI